MTTNPIPDDEACYPDEEGFAPYRVGCYAVFVAAVAFVVGACGVGLLMLWRMV